MPRTASEIDAAKYLAMTDLDQITTEVRQFPPGYVTGGKLKLNTNLQIEVAPMAINIAGHDVKLIGTTIIGNEHWVVDKVITPRVPGNWYYLYLSSDAVFAVSPNEPEYNELYFAYYHPIISNLRAIGKFYLGNNGKVLYVQTSLETILSRVLIAASTYRGEDANYYCTGEHDEILIQAAIYFLDEVYNGGIAILIGGKFNLDGRLYGISNLTFELSSDSTIVNRQSSYALTFQNKSNFLITGNGIFTSESSASNYVFYMETNSKWNINNINISSCNNGIYVYGGADNVIYDYSYVQDCSFNRISGTAILLSYAQYIHVINNYFSSVCYGVSVYDGFGAGYTQKIKISNNTISNVFDMDTVNRALWIPGDEIYWVEVIGNSISNITGLYNNSMGYRAAAIYIGAAVYHTLVANNYCVDNGNLIDRSACNNSSTGPVMFTESTSTASNASWGFTSTSPYEGTGQYRFSKDVAAGTKAYVHLVDNVGAADIHGLTLGVQYEWSGWFKCYSSASGGYQGLRFYQATTGGGATSATVVTIATASWQWIAVTATIYAAATTAYIGIWASASLGSTTYFDVDNLRLFQPGIGNAHRQNFYDSGTDTLWR